MAYILQTLPGLGPLAWQEATGKRLERPTRKTGSGSGPIRFVPGKNDLVLLRSRRPVADLLGLRVSEDVFAVATRGFHIAADSRGLRQVYAAIRQSTLVGDATAAWRETLQRQRRPGTFRVVTRMVGTHDFRRRELQQTAAEAIQSGWPGRWRQADENADIEVWVTLLEHELLCGIRLSGAEMRHRHSAPAGNARWQHMPAALRPALAAAMVMLSEPAPSDVFLDPMAGSGTLLAERAAAGPFGKLYAGDNSSAAVAALRANLRRIKGDVQCQQWDARDLPLPDASVDKVVVNLPFGKQVAATTDVSALYRGVLAQIQRVLRPGGRLVVLVGDRNLFDAAQAATAPRLRPDARQRVAVLGQPAFIYQATQPA